MSKLTNREMLLVMPPAGQPVNVNGLLGFVCHHNPGQQRFSIQIIGVDPKVIENLHKKENWPPEVKAALKKYSLETTAAADEGKGNNKKNVTLDVQDGSIDASDIFKKR